MLLPYTLCRQVALAACFVFLATCFYGTAFSSITLAVIGGSALLGADWKYVYQRLKHDRFSLAMIGIFLIYLLSGLYSTNYHFFFFKLNQKLAYLILPIACMVFFPVSKRLFHALLATFFMAILLTATYSTVNFISNYEAVKELYIFGKTMWTPRDHIRFSLGVVVAIWFGIFLFINAYSIRWPAEKWFWLFASLLLVLYLHVLSVRSGLLAFYTGVLFSIAYFIFIKRNVRLAIGLLMLMPLFFAAAWQFSPTLQTKMRYMQYDVLRFMNNEEVAGHSDGGRLLSQKVGISIIAANKLIGVGLGDAKDEIEKEYATTHTEVAAHNRFEPHNQFVFIGVVAGLLGLLAFLVALLMLWLANRNYSKWLFSVVLLVFVSSFLAETTLEMQLGTMLFLFFMSILHNQLEATDTKKQTL